MVGCRRRGAEIRIEVRDNGPGIAHEQLNLVQFEKRSFFVENAPCHAGRGSCFQRKHLTAEERRGCAEDAKVP
jgi:sensor histidine kinase regulating citrate/malate metabolism